MPFNPLVGEFRVHYAGFFDPGFGHGGEGQGSRAVLEVRSHEVPFLLEHGQTVGWLRYERLTAPPARLPSESAVSVSPCVTSGSTSCAASPPGLLAGFPGGNPCRA